MIEACNHIGGRMVVSEALGAPFDAGAQFLHPNCSQMLALAEQHGISTTIAPNEGSMVRSFKARAALASELRATVTLDAPAKLS